MADETVRLAQEIGEINGKLGALLARQDLEDIAHDEINKNLAKLYEYQHAVPQDVHVRHHQHTDAQIEKLNAERDFWRALKLSVAKRGFWMVLLGLLIGVGFAMGFKSEMMALARWIWGEK